MGVVAKTEEEREQEGQCGRRGGLGWQVARSKGMGREAGSIGGVRRSGSGGRMGPTTLGRGHSLCTNDEKDKGETVKGSVRPPPGKNDGDLSRRSRLPKRNHGPGRQPGR